MRPLARTSGSTSNDGERSEPRGRLATRSGWALRQATGADSHPSGRHRPSQHSDRGRNHLPGQSYPTEVALDRKANLPKESFVQLDNLQTASKDRFVKYIGSLDLATMRTVGRTLILALGLDDAI
jgi:hypothetical protein